ncbi:DNA cytosine methyltransferase [Roseibium aggregatum]|uniref:Cytosine-specific methyltransferase n=1 Tax=Roseibium aggregatum TaxID=187304 RepID=A0A0M6Y830_9HYPH|nr:DNA cytosine methyltransferase [Roseibium aggregatum]CTQ45693.1 Modification methylase HaeIII [Roseibium aggregatum]
MKPSYRVPTVAEVKAREGENGYKVASFFAGCGGSSFGYRLAGFKVVYANEFVEEARNAYAANAGEGTIIDGRDIRSVDPQDVLYAADLEEGELDILDGSPPCASFSMAGARDRLWGKEKNYSDVKQRTDDLFDHYVRMVDGIRPKVFQAENVAGMVRGSSVGHFLNALDDFERAGYDVEARLVNFAFLGCPQSRVRLFFQGVRRDLVEEFNVRPSFPKPLGYTYSIADACPWVVPDLGDTVELDRSESLINQAGIDLSVELASRMDRQMTDPSKAYAVGEEWLKLKPGEQSDRFFQLVRCDPDKPAPTITATGGHPSAASVTHPYENRKFSIAEVRRLSGFPDDFVFTGSYMQQFERAGRSVLPFGMMRLADTIESEILDRLV